ncbi:PEHE domain-containing protein [Entamoeba marina]
MSGEANDHTAEIETPIWSKYVYNPSTSTSEDEPTDEEMYAKLHAPFEQIERKRYVNSILNAEESQYFTLSMIQFLKIEEVDDIIPTYKHPKKPLNRTEHIKNKIRTKQWKTKDINKHTISFEATK